MRLVHAIPAIFLAAAGCEMGGPARGAGGAQGQVGTSFGVVVARPLNGTVTSADGALRCGTGGDACSASYPWSASVVLTATPDPGFSLEGWAGDCSQAGPCLLDTSRYGADKYVVAVFSPAGQAGHSNWTSAALHAPAYRDFLAQAPGALTCADCHGAALQGQGLAVSCDACHATNGYGHWKANASCTACHGDATRTAVPGADPVVSAAPPVDTHGNVTRGTRGVGAHEAHLNGSARPLACSECHVVPTSTSHADGVVTVTFGSLATTAGAKPLWNGASCAASYCHGATLTGGSNTVPIWISGPSQATCGSCHGVPPPPPHTTSTQCGDCHVGYSSTTVDPARHVNGTLDVLPLGCTSCHGTPPSTGQHTRSEHVGRSCGDCHPGYTSTTANLLLHQNGATDLGSSITSYDRAARTCTSTCHDPRTW